MRLTTLKPSRSEQNRESSNESQPPPVSTLRRSGSASSLARSSRRDRDRILAGFFVSLFVCILALLIVTPLVSGSLFHRESASEKAMDHASTTANTLKEQASKDIGMIHEQAKDVYGRFKEDHDLPGLRDRASDYLHDTAHEASEYVKAKAQDASHYVKEKVGMIDPLPEPTLMDRVKTKVGNILHPNHQQTVEERVKAKIMEKKQEAREYAQDAADRLKHVKDELMKKKNLDNAKDYVEQKYEDAKDSHIYASLEDKATAMKNRVLGKAPQQRAESLYEKAKDKVENVYDKITGNEKQQQVESLYERAKDRVEDVYDNVKDRLSSAKESVSQSSPSSPSSSSSSQSQQDSNRLTKQQYKNRIRELAHEAIEDALNQVEDEDRTTLESIIHRVKGVLHLNPKQE